MIQTHKHPQTARRWLGRALVALDAARQLVCCTEAIAHDPHYAPAWYWRGSVRLAQGQFRAAEHDFSVALQLNPRLTRAWDERAYARLQLGHIDTAIADFRQALHLNPANEPARRYLAECIMKNV